MKLQCFVHTMQGAKFAKEKIIRETFLKKSPFLTIPYRTVHFATPV